MRCDFNFHLSDKIVSVGRVFLVINFDLHALRVIWNLNWVECFIPFCSVIGTFSASRSELEWCLIRTFLDVKIVGDTVQVSHSLNFLLCPVKNFKLYNWKLKHRVFWFWIKSIWNYWQWLVQSLILALRNKRFKMLVLLVLISMRVNHRLKIRKLIILFSFAWSVVYRVEFFVVDLFINT